MSNFIIPDKYHSPLGTYDTQVAIGFLKRTFEDKLSKSLNLIRVSAPLFVDPKTGLNDDLNGVERAVNFDIKETGAEAHIVHSLATWKRQALKNYGFPIGQGIYTDMNAIRRDEEMDNLHSIYVDQWDWEKVISREDRNVDYLKATVKAIVAAIADTKEELNKRYPALKTTLCREVAFVTTQQLEDRYPDLTPKEREDAFLEEYKTAFVMQIGDVLKSGIKHDGRAPDYDDWALNGDILFYDEVLGRAFEVSSMGIRVDAASMDSQLKKAGADHRRAFPFHKAVLADELPLTMGGGIGQSRLSMLLLEKAHIGEVQVSLWDEDTLTQARKNGIVIL
ncbi:MAG: aspartate--ammonia ligase [Clostridia bacterium]|nr:aspartate--ammonia ligase [Clostridia bacterium]